jgi:hypothetical protein
VLLTFLKSQTFVPIFDSPKQLRSRGGFEVRRQIIAGAFLLKICRRSADID